MPCQITHNAMADYPQSFDPVVSLFTAQHDDDDSMLHPDIKLSSLILPPWYVSYVWPLKGRSGYEGIDGVNVFMAFKRLRMM